MKHKYAEEVDVISIIYLLRKLKILMKVVLSNQQQFLLNFDESSNLKSIKYNGEQNDYLANYDIFLNGDNSSKIASQIDNWIESSKANAFAKVRLYNIFNIQLKLSHNLYISSIIIILH